MTENSPGALMTKLASDTANVNSIILSIIGVMTQTIVTVAVGLILGFIYDWRITLINMAFIPLLIISSFYYYKIAQKESEVKTQ